MKSHALAHRQKSEGFGCVSAITPELSASVYRFVQLYTHNVLSVEIMFFTDDIKRDYDTRGNLFQITQQARW